MEDIGTKDIRSKKDELLDRLKARHEDFDSSDEDGVFGRIIGDYDQFDKELSERRDQEQKVSDLFSTDPRSAKFFGEWASGGDPVASLIREFGDEIVEAVGNPDKAEEISEARKEYLEHIAKSKALEEEYEKNISSSLEGLEGLMSKKGMSEEDLDKYITFIGEISGKYLSGVIDEAMIDVAMKALNYDAAVESALQEGVVKGRNEKIEMTKKKQSPRSGDGMPHFGGGVGAELEKKDRRPEIFKIADGAK